MSLMPILRAARAGIMRAADGLALAARGRSLRSLDRAGSALQQEPGLQRTEALDLDLAAALAIERGQRAPRLGGELHSLGFAAGFEPGRQVHRVAPDIVGKFAAANNAGHHRPGGDADAHSDRHPEMLSDRVLVA